MLHFNTTAFTAEDEPDTGGEGGAGEDEPSSGAEGGESESNIMLYALLLLVAGGIGMMVLSTLRNRDEDGPESEL